MTSIPKRRGSILDYGGVNSLNNFASSYTRAQSYLGSSMREADSNENAIEDEESSPGVVRIPSRRPTPTTDENTHLLQPVKSAGSRRSSIGSKGSSTAPQTIFNSINTLIGMAMLSLPFGLKLSGWFIGTALFMASAIVTSYTAMCLGRVLHKRKDLNSYGDIAYAYGGKTFSAVVTFIFTVDLLGACLSLMVLFADSFHIVVPSISTRAYKAILVSIVFFLSLLPLSMLSMLSLVGIFSTISVLSIVIICGVCSPVSPGSLLNPAETNAWPSSMMNVLLSLGIFMCPWGGHPVFPELYRDMRHPNKYNGCCRVSFSATFLLDFSLGAVGFLMFGLSCDDSIIKTLMNNEAYPVWVRPTLCVLMGLLGVSKLPLITRPLITVFEGVLNLQPNHKEAYSAKRLVGRAAFCLIFLIISLMVNSFGKIVSFMGSAVCYTICVSLPLTFYLHFFKQELSTMRIWIIRAGIVCSVVCAILGTYSVVVMDI